MSQRILESRLLELMLAPSAKRTSGGGEDYAFDFRARSARDALKNRAVLAVHRNDLTATLNACLLRQGTCNYERLLVRKSHTLARSKRGKRRVKSCCPDDRVEHDVRSRKRRGVDETFD